MINGSAFSLLQVEQESAVSKEIKDFISSVNENSKPLTDGWFALAVFKIIESISY